MTHQIRMIRLWTYRLQRSQGHTMYIYSNKIFHVVSSYRRIGTNSKYSIMNCGPGSLAEWLQQDTLSHRWSAFLRQINAISISRWCVGAIWLTTVRRLLIHISVKNQSTNEQMNEWVNQSINQPIKNSIKGLFGFATEVFEYTKYNRKVSRIHRQTNVFSLYFTLSYSNLAV